MSEYFDYSRGIQEAWLPVPYIRQMPSDNGTKQPSSVSIQLYNVDEIAESNSAGAPTLTSQFVVNNIPEVPRARHHTSPFHTAYCDTSHITFQATPLIPRSGKEHSYVRAQIFLA